MPSGDTLSVTLFLIGLAMAFYIQTLNPEVPTVRISMLIIAAILLVVGISWAFLGVIFPTFAGSSFALSMTSFASSPLTWFSLLMVSLIANSLIPTVERWRANRLPPSSVATVLPPSIEAPMKGNNLSLALSRIFSASTLIDTEPVPSGIIFVVVQSYVNYTPRENFPLKLHVIWTNEGEEIRLGKPQWKADRLSTQGGNLGQKLMHRYKVSLGKEGTESEELVAKHGQRGELWLGLDPSVDVEQARLWNVGSQLGVLVLPVTVRNITTEVQIRL
jgi:hypothetical protein